MPMTTRMTCTMILLLTTALGAAACKEGRKSRRPPAPSDTAGDPLPLLPFGDDCRAELAPLVASVPVSATTAGAADDFVAPCNPATRAGDVVFKLVLAEAAGVAIDVVSDGELDPVVYLRTSPCGEADAVPDACSDLSGTRERLELASLAAGEYAVIVDTVDVAGGGGAGDFTLTATLFPAGLCVGDEFDRTGTGASVQDPIPVGAWSVDTASSGVPLRLCDGDVDLFVIGHMGGAFSASVTTGTGELYAAVPLFADDEPLLDGGEVLVDQGALVGALPFSGSLAAGMLLVRVTGSALPAAGVDYALQVTHACEPDPFDHPLAALDDASFDRAYVVFSDLEPGPVDRTLCGGDADTFLVAADAAGEVQLTLTNGAPLTVRVAAIEPGSGAATPVTIVQTPAGDDQLVSFTALAGEVYQVTVGDDPAAAPASTRPYRITAAVPAVADPCALAVDLAGATSPFAGSTLGSADRFDPAQLFGNPTACGDAALPGPDALFTRTVPADTVLRATVDAEFDVVLWAVDTCPYALVCLGAADQGRDPFTDSEALEVYGDGSPIYLVVDAKDPLARGAYTLSWTLSAASGLPLCGNAVIEDGEQCDDGQLPPLDGDGCDGACQRELGHLCPPAGGACQTLPVLNGDDTCPAGLVPLPLPGPAAGPVTGFVAEAAAMGAGDDLEGSCGGVFGPEVIYTLAATSAASYRISTAGADTFLYVYADTCGSLADEVACNTNAPGATDGGSAVTLTTEAGVTYYVVIDFFVSLPPPVTVLVERLP